MSQTVADNKTGLYRERRLKRAAEHVSDYWFPANPKLLRKIQQGLKDGSYNGRTHFLLEEIKEDFALFSHCLRRLVQMLNNEQQRIDPGVQPLKLLEACDLDRLKSLLSSREGILSAHPFAETNDTHMQRLREVLISASAAEMLAPSYAADPEAAYSAALLRQLGLTLIVWNYPTAYQEAIVSLNSGRNLETALTQLLGFSPITLALRVLHSWGLSAECCAAWGLAEDDQLDEPEIPLAGKNLAELCKVGEALARANRGECYPSARHDWQWAKEQIIKRLGPQGMEIITDKFKEHCRHYLEFAPEIFEAGLLSPSDSPAECPSSALEPDNRTNPFIARCTSPVQRELLHLYEQLKSGQIGEESLRSLVKTTIISSGFRGGCIYTLDSGTMHLMPQIEIGASQVRNYEPISYSIGIAHSHIVAVAYRSSAPVQAYKKTRVGTGVRAIAGIFGRSHRVGVLYLETDTPNSRAKEAEQLIHFKALQYALNDCLGLT